jgi:hypothetical protein
MARTTPASRPSGQPRVRQRAARKDAALPAADSLTEAGDDRDGMVIAVPSGTQELPASRPITQDAATAGNSTVIELPARPRPRKKKPSGPPRFRIFIIDSGWNTVVRRALRHNFALIRRLHKEDPIYLLSRKKSRDFIHRHRSLIGRDPIVAVHDMEAIDQHGSSGFHGFHLHRGILRTPRQALTALQVFARFLRTHRQSSDLEADIRRELRREGLLGSVEIFLHKVPRVVGG